jgi:mannose-6-phosphate isomerase-like protein (cupin superfamily)
MFIKHLANCRQFVAGDNSLLRELLNPNTEHLDIEYSLAWAQVQPGKKTRPHTLDCSEVYYLLKGTGIMHINKEEKTVQKHDVVFIPPEATQWIENTGTEPLELLCIVNPAWQPDKEHITSN